MGDQKIAFLTGGTGFLGRHLLKELMANGFGVRVLVRDPSMVSPIDRVEWVVGSLQDCVSIDRGVEGASHVFHTAALNEFWQKDKRRFYEVNVQGTENVFRAALKFGTKRVVYTSSLAALGSAEEGKFVHEKNPFNLHEVRDDYVESKFQAEKIAQDYVRQGLPVVILNPTAIVGPEDSKPTPIGKIIQSAVRGRLPFYIPTRINFVDVRDVARMHLVAAEKGRVGERYLIGGENLHFHEFLKRVARYAGKPAPRYAFPIPFVKALSYGAVAWARATGCPPLFSPNSIRMAERNFFCECSKAREELGLVPTPIEETIREAVGWYLSNREIYGREIDFY